MVETAIAAFTMGVIGSFHCIGMCGPMALALPLSEDNLRSKFFGALLYNCGRIVTYSAFGLAAGLVGSSFAFFGFQQWLSIVMGTAIILLVVLPKLFPAAFGKINITTSFFLKVRQTLGTLFFKKNQSTLFAIGLLNGLLPCAMVYLALAGAAATGAVLNATIFMAAFGLGTLPVMWTVAFWGNFISLGIRQKIRTVYPFIMLLMACLLIIRGMGLGIPYISPVDNSKERISCSANL